jgi:hypothetical protein
VGLRAAGGARVPGRPCAARGSAPRRPRRGGARRGGRAALRRPLRRGPRREARAPGHGAGAGGATSGEHRAAAPRRRCRIPPRWRCATSGRPTCARPPPGTWP